MKNYTVSQIAKILKVTRIAIYKRIEFFPNAFKDETTGILLIPESDLLSYDIPAKTRRKLDTCETTVRQEMKRMQQLRKKESS